MSPQSEAASLLQRVQKRLTTVRFAKTLHWWTFGSLIAACVSVLSIRLLGLLPESQQRLEWLLIFPAAASLGAWLFFRRVEQTSAARLIDQHARTDDLFLTLATLNSSAGEYQPLVETSAAKVAPRITPAEVVPFRPQRPVGLQAVAMIALALLVWLLPTLDPFGKVEAATKVERQKKAVDQILKSVKVREEQLSKVVKSTEERQEKIDAETKELMAALKKMKPAEKQMNSEVLKQHRSELNNLWQNVSKEELRQMLSQSVSDEQFGGEKSKKMNEWLKDLQNGKTDGLKQELDKARETMESMLSANTPEERQKLASDLKKQLQDLKKFSSKKAGSKDLENALDKALKAMEALAQKEKSGKQGENGEPSEESEGEAELSKQAAEAMKEAMELAKTELEEVARSAEDLKTLEEALKTLQQAEKLNNGEQLDGEECEGCQSLAEYAKKFKEMMGQNGQGQDGEAQRNEPGAMMTEDDSDPEGYKDEKSRSQVQAGKVLLSIKTKEAATERDFNEEDYRKYEASVNEVKSGVQAAIESEQIPPGYVDSIKKYFDTLDAPKGEAAPKEEPPK
jgi:hypothetical protein